MASKFQLETVMELGKCQESEAREIIEVIENQALVQSWLNGTNNSFKIAIKYARLYIKNGYSWETEIAN